MNVSRSKILSLIASILLFASLILSFLLLVTQAINNSIFKPEGGDISTNISIGCGTAVLIFMLIFAVIAQIFATLLTFVSIFPSKRKGLVFASNSFAIVFCVLALFMYIVTFISFAELQNGSDSAKFVNACLIGSAVIDCFAIYASIVSMIAKGKTKVLKGMKQEDLPAPFIVGDNENCSENTGENTNGNDCDNTDKNA